MATGTYGNPGSNQYTIQGVNGQLSNVVNAQTGVSQIYRPRAGGLAGYESIGTYNPSTGRFTPAGNLSTAEAQADVTVETPACLYFNAMFSSQVS